MYTNFAEKHLKARKYGQQGNCSRCNGLGYISIFRHVADGVCFECLGSGNSKQPSSKVSTSSFIQQPRTRRWFIGFLKHGKNLEQLFAFTASSVEEGNDRVRRELENTGLATDYLGEHFELCIGDKGEDKKTILLKFDKQNSLSLN